MGVSCWHIQEECPDLNKFLPIVKIKIRHPAWVVCPPHYHPICLWSDIIPKAHIPFHNIRWYSNTHRIIADNVEPIQTVMGGGHYELIICWILYWKDGSSPPWHCYQISPSHQIQWNRYSNPLWCPNLYKIPCMWCAPPQSLIYSSPLDHTK